MTKHTIHIYWKGVKEYKEESKNQIPNDGGVYEILVKNKNTGKFIRKYIGQTEDLQQRYLEHLSDDEENSDIYNGVRKYVCGFDHVLVEDEDDRKDAEKNLYKEHDYSWNEQEPEGSDRNLEIEVIEHSS